MTSYGMQTGGCKMQVGREPRVTAILMSFYKEQGWVLFEEFAIPGTILNLGTAAGVPRKRLRPDIMGLMGGVILAIEVENAPFLHHATSYLHISNYCYLAYPADSEKTLTPETLEDQLRYAQKNGIGVLQVWVDPTQQSQVVEVLPAMHHELPPEVKARLVGLMWNRYKRKH